MMEYDVKADWNNVTCDFPTNTVIKEENKTKHDPVAIMIPSKISLWLQLGSMLQSNPQQHVLACIVAGVGRLNLLFPMLHCPPAPLVFKILPYLQGMANRDIKGWTTRSWWVMLTASQPRPDMFAMMTQLLQTIRPPLVFQVFSLPPQQTPCKISAPLQQPPCDGSTRRFTEVCLNTLSFLLITYFSVSASSVSMVISSIFHLFMFAGLFVIRRQRWISRAYLQENLE